MKNVLYTESFLLTSVLSLAKVVFVCFCFFKRSITDYPSNASTLFKVRKLRKKMSYSEQEERTTKQALQVLLGKSPS